MYSSLHQCETATVTRQVCILALCLSVGESGRWTSKHAGERCQAVNTLETSDFHNKAFSLFVYDPLTK